jgi:hypothetical protein
LVCFTLSACDFNINDSPGPQMSSSIKESKSHDTFICGYRIKGNKINNIPIEEIFAEHQFWRKNDHFLLKKSIDCYQSQLVIVSSEPFVVDGIGSDINWKVVGFDTHSSYMLNKNYKSILLPDSIPIIVVVIKGEDSSKVIQKLTLYKVR